MAVEYEFRLEDMDLPPGRITAADLAAISARLQDLSTRVSRWVADIEGAGRGPRAVEDAARLVVGVEAGSTVLAISRGVHGTLDFPTPFEDRTDERFWGIVEAIAKDEPPAEAPDTVRESAVGLLDALGKAAPRVTVSSQRGRVQFRPAERDRSRWRVQPIAVEDTEASFSGKLEMVDLRSAKFRIADDIGNRIVLTEVADAESVAQTLVGRHVTARGPAVKDSKGRIQSITSPALEELVIPTAWQTRPTASFNPPADYKGPDLNAPVIFDDEEAWAAFRAAVKGEPCGCGQH